MSEELQNIEPTEEIEEETADQPDQIEDDLATQLQKCEDKYLRAYAEFENIKKRLEREKYQAIDYASEQFAKDMLSVIDTLDMALKIEDKEQFDKLKEGVGLTRDNLLKTYEKHGITQISHENGFDPNFHEAVMQQDSPDHEDNEIVMVMQQGYQFKERVIRPSLVSVCKK